MPVTQLPDISELVVDFTIDPIGAGGAGGVPTSRRIDTALPLTGGGDLTANRMLDINIQPDPSPAVVGTNLMINGIGPVGINGTGGSGTTLTANPINVSVDAFDGTHDGYVVKNPSGILGYFMRDDGSFAPGAVAGVASIAGVSPVVVSAPTGAVSVSVQEANLVHGGILPPVGTADASQALLRTNPPSWGTWGGGTFVTRQASAPGVAESGNVWLSGIILSSAGVWGGGRVVEGSSLNPLIPIDSCLAAAEHATAYNLLSMVHTGVGAHNGMEFYKTRGTPAAPGQTSPDDIIHKFMFYGRGTSGTPAPGATIEARCDLATGNVYHPGKLFLAAGIPSGASGGPAFASAKFNYLGVLFSNGVYDPSTADQAHSGVDVGCSFGRRFLSLTPNPGPDTRVLTDADPSVIFVDCTSGSQTVQLPASAATNNGRTITIVRGDIGGSGKFLNVTVGGGQFINGMNPYRMAPLESLTFYSLGASWQVMGGSTNYDLYVSKADNAAVANTTVETTLFLVSGVIPNLGLVSGQLVRLVASGKLSTTGTPTLRIRAKSGATAVADTTAITMPSGVTDEPWQLEVVYMCRSIAGPVGRTLRATFMLGTTTQTVYNMIRTFTPVGVAISEVTAEWGTASASNSITCVGHSYAQTPRTEVA